MTSTSTMAQKTVVPPTIPALSLDRVLEAVRHLGFNTADVKELHVYRRHVEVDLFLRTEAGEYVAAGEEPASAFLSIPILDEPMFETRLPGEAVLPDPPNLMEA